MLDYINSTVHALGSYPIAWDVINEAINDTNGEIRDSPWKNIPDFICKAFNATRSANPKIGRFYNDFNIITSQKKQDSVYKLVKDLVDRNCGITGVGMQAHVSIDYKHEGVLISALKQYEELGLDVHITELTVKCEYCNETWTDG
jgi:endo-1,4-beta-xylanase